MGPTHAQYHHYIPRFILQTFADNFSLIKSNTEYLATSTPGVFESTERPIVKQGGGKKGKKSKEQKDSGPPPREIAHHINVYQVADCTIELSDIARAYGIFD
ncbi:hypothetical protein BGZ95_005786, partial [Linnemannia exigua]